MRRNQIFIRIRAMSGVSGFSRETADLWLDEWHSNHTAIPKKEY